MKSLWDDIKHVKYGFMPANYPEPIDPHATAARYETALSKAFPNATVDVVWEEGIQGVTPFDLQTAVDFGYDEYHREEESAIAYVADVLQDVEPVWISEQE